MTKKSKIYTKTGDMGTTSLIGGKRVKKCSLRLDTYGTIDELNAHTGLLRSLLIEDKELAALPPQSFEFFIWLQSRLFDIGTHLAMPCTQQGEMPPCSITESHVQHLESAIDWIDQQLEPLQAFILPGGTIEASQCHVCRTVCRRAERLVTALAEEIPISPLLLAFINRLSDFWFVCARFINKIKTVDEISWKNDCN